MFERGFDTGPDLSLTIAILGTGAVVGANLLAFAPYLSSLHLAAKLVLFSGFVPGFFFGTILLIDVAMRLVRRLRRYERSPGRGSQDVPSRSGDAL